jgi:pilus assembly protein CpaB
VTRRSGWILFSLGLVLALGSGALVYVLLQQQSTRATEQARAQVIAEVQAQVQTVPLPVAARALDPGRPITTEDIIVKDFPVDLVPTSAVTSSVDLESQVLVRAVGEGELFQRSQLLGENGSTVSQQIRPGFVLFAFPIVDLMGQSNILQDGDRVDLLVTYVQTDPNNPNPSATTALTLQNIEVFKVLRPVDDEGNAGVPTALMCLMSPEDAVMLKFIKDSGGTIDFALRSPLDADPFVAPPVSQSDLVGRYLQAQ